MNVYVEGKRMSEQNIKRLARQHNVKVEGLESARVWVTCAGCGQGWSPNLQPGGKLPRGWWKRPQGCNVKS